MLIVLVNVHVKPGMADAFKNATLENAAQSIKEPGIRRFDVIQQNDDPQRFVLIEIYTDPEAPARHKETAHYKLWRDRVEGMMFEPRRSFKYTNLFPDDQNWD